MTKAILIINGHPDASSARLCAALTAAYERGAQGAGHVVRRLDIGLIDIPLMASRDEYESTDLAPQIALAQRDVAWADHVVIIFPLWLGTMPAKLKALLEQVLRKDFAFGPKGFGEARLKGKSARVVVTMGMPAIIYRLVFAAHGVLGLEQGILKMVGFSPVRHNLLGDVETRDVSRREHWLRLLEQEGAKGQ